MALIPSFAPPAAVAEGLSRIDPTALGLWLVALAVLIVGLVAAILQSQAARRQTRTLRLERLETCSALLDEAIARCIEIEDRYTHPELRGADDQSVLLTLRRELAVHVSKARALIEAYGDLREPRLAAEAIVVAERPIFVASPTDAEVERSLPELRRLCARLRNDQLETMARLRRGLPRRTWGKVLAKRG